MTIEELKRDVVYSTKRPHSIYGWFSEALVVFIGTKVEEGLMDIGDDEPPKIEFALFDILSKNFEGNVIQDGEVLELSRKEVEGCYWKEVPAEDLPLCISKPWVATSKMEQYVRHI